jgi:hypothetical protein
MKLSLFVVSLVAACALMVALATSAFASTDSHFPDGVPMSPTAGVTGCTVLSTSPATTTGSSTGLGNKADLFVDACLGGP